MIIVISLKRANERRDLIKKQLEAFNIDAMIMDAVDAQDLSEEQKNKKLHMPNGWRFGESFEPGEIACLMSHKKAIETAKENKAPYVIVLEDDVIFAEDFTKRIKFLLKILPQNWEHVYLSGAPKFNLQYLPNLQFMNVVPSIITDGAFSIMIRDTAYDKVISELSTFKSTSDDIYGRMILDKQLVSYTFYPFVTYTDDDFTYIWNEPVNREHKSKKYFKSKL